MTRTICARSVTTGILADRFFFFLQRRRDLSRAPALLTEFHSMLEHTATTAVPVRLTWLRTDRSAGRTMGTVLAGLHSNIERVSGAPLPTDSTLVSVAESQ